MMFMHVQLIGKMMCIFNWCWSLLIEMYTIPIHRSMDSGRLHHYVLKIPTEHENPAGTVFITSSNFGLKGVQGVLIELEWLVLSFECSGCFWIPWLFPKKTTGNTISKPLWHSTSRFRGLTGDRLFGLENWGTPKPWIISRKKVGTWRNSMTRARPEWWWWYCLVEAGWTISCHPTSTWVFCVCVGQFGALQHFPGAY